MRTVRRISLFLVLALAALAQDNFKFSNLGCSGSDPELADRRYFVICHSDSFHVPLWVSYELSRRDLTGKAPRKDAFRQDTALRGEGARLVDYVDSGYSRGHMAPANDFKRSATAMRTTFLLSNMVPQLQGVNNGRWKQLEKTVQIIVKNAGVAYIITGPVFDDVKVDTIGDDDVGVPTHTFKVILAIDKDGEKTMYAAIVPNTNNANEPLANYVATVHEVERRTGLNFFSKLEPAEERRLENKMAMLPNKRKPQATEQRSSGEK